MESSQVSAIVSIAIGFAGLCFGLYERKRRVAIQSVFRAHLSGALNRVRALVSYRAEIYAHLEEGCDPSRLRDWIWEHYKGTSDLYVWMVTLWVAYERSFQYADLKKTRSGRCSRNKMGGACLARSHCGACGESKE